MTPVRKRYVMLVDIKACIGCHTCAIACQLGNNIPKGIKWNRVLTNGGPTMDTPHGVFPNLEMRYLTIACQHCERPACVDACPARATYQRDDGIVMQDYDLCLGCRMCIMACPYSNVRSYHEHEPAYFLDFAVGDKAVKAQQKGTVSKCNLCCHRVDQGLKPNCIEVCPARARHFGDMEDKDSEVWQLLQTRTHIRLMTDANTEPSVFYLT